MCSRLNRKILHIKYTYYTINNVFQVEDYSNKVASVFKAHGYKKGDAVALLLENRPEYVGIWLGLSKLGIITPLINTNLRKSSLLHSINVAGCQALIYGADLGEGIIIHVKFFI